MNRLLLTLASISLLVGTLIVLFSPSDALANEIGLDINTGVPSGDPIFVVENMLPGDSEEREITATNNTDYPELVAVRCEEVDELKHLSEVLEMVIKENSTDIYGGSLGTKTVEEFCDEASDEDGIPLSVVPDGDTDTYKFIVTFPPSAGNEYQEGLYIFDLIFGYVTGDDLLLNEVYYKVDDEHGHDCPKDRGIDVDIINNGPYSRNIVDLNVLNMCMLVQKNSANNSNRINARSRGGSVSVNIFNTFNFNFGSCCCGGPDNGRNDEWVEIYNPTNRRISLKDYYFVDNSGVQTIINSNTRVDPKQFVLVSKSSSTWSHWDEHPDAEKVRLGSDIGDGLDNNGDHVYLYNPDGDVVDFVAWRDDDEDWDPAVPNVDPGHSIQRIILGFDSDIPEDWQDNIFPTPGYY